MRPEDISAQLPPDKRQIFDSLCIEGRERFEAKRFALSPSSQVRRPEEPRVPRRPVGDRMRVG